MNIVIFADIFLPHIDGVTNSLVHLVKEYAKQGHQVLVLAPKTKGYQKVKLAGVKIFFLPSIPAVVYPELMLGLFSPKLFRVLKEFSADVVHVVGPGTLGSMGLLYAKMLGIKSVAVFHTYFMQPEYLRNVGIKHRGVKMAQSLLWKLTRTFYDSAHVVVTPSKFVKKDLLNHDFKSKIVVINNAVDFSNIKILKKKQDSFIKKYGLENYKIILYVGRVSVEKNIDDLLKVFVKVKETVEKTKLVIVGDGPYLAKLKQLVTKLGIKDKVVFTGSIKNTELFKIGVFNLASVFVTTSHSEVQPISILEAMYFSLPIVAVKSRGLVEMIEGNGYLVSPNLLTKFAKAVIKILEDEKLQQQLGKHSKELVKQYSVAVMVKEYLKIYNS